jgi:hypothetical protein
MLESHASSADERMPRMSNVVKVKESISFKWPRAETLRAWRYVMDETYESPEESQRRLTAFAVAASLHDKLEFHA